MNMNPDYLSESEIDYELKLRNEAVEGSKDKKKRALKNLMKTEEEGARAMILLTTVEEEIEEISKKLTELEKLWESGKNTKDTAFQEKTRSKLCHYKTRLDCIGLSDSSNVVLPKLMKTVDQLAAKLKEASVKEKRGRRLEYRDMVLPSDEQMKILSAIEKQRLKDAMETTIAILSKCEESDEDSGEETLDFNRTLIINDDRASSNHDGQGEPNNAGPFRFNNGNCRMVERRSPVTHWNLKFEGKPECLLDFLEDVSFRASAESVSNEELFKTAFHLFSKQALKWYKAFHKTFNTWQELVQALKKHFLKKDFDFVQIGRIRDRRQQEDEQFLTYFADVELMFQRLSQPISESEKLIILRRNMLPYLRARLATIPIRSVTILVELCHEIESDYMPDISNRDTRTNVTNENKNVSIISTTPDDILTHTIATEACPVNTYRNSNHNNGSDSKSTRNQLFERKSAGGNRNTQGAHSQSFINNVPNNNQLTNVYNQARAHETPHFASNQFTIQNDTRPNTHFTSIQSQGYNNSEAYQPMYLNNQPTQPPIWGNSVQGSNQNPSITNWYGNGQPGVNYAPVQPGSNMVGAAQSVQYGANGAINNARLVICFRCKQLGHPFSACRANLPYRRFCFGCGHEDVIKRNCPNCSRQGNGQ
jgi:hypothetical protein